METLQNKHILHSSIFNSTLRDWQCFKSEITSKNLMYPIFIVEDDDAVEPIQSMPGISRYGINKTKDHLAELIQKGLKSILVFGVIDTLLKGLIKIIYVFLNRKKAVHIVKKIKDFWSLDVVDEELQRKIKRRQLFLTVFVNSHFFITILLIISYLIHPFISIPEGRTRKLHVLIWFPFNTDASPLFEILDTILMCSAILSLYGHLLYDGIFIYCVEHLSQQFIIIKALMRKLGDDLMEHCDDVDKFKSKGFQQEVAKRIKICVTHHTMLLKQGHAIREFSSTVLGFQVIVGFFALVAVGFVLDQLADDSRIFIDKMEIRSLVLSLALEVIIYCLQCTELHYQSSSVADAVYQAKWHLFDVTNKKSLIKIIMNSQNGITIHAARLIRMDNALIVQFGQKVFSALTLLRSIGETEQQ